MITSGNLVPSASLYKMYSDQEVQWHTCQCEKHQPHCNGYEDVIGKPWSIARRLKVDTAMAKHLYAVTCKAWTYPKQWTKSWRQHVSFDDRPLKRRDSGPWYNICSQTGGLYHTENAMRAKEKKKADKTVGGKPRRKPFCVEAIMMI